MQQNYPSTKLLVMASNAIINRLPALAILLLWILCCPPKALSQTVIFVDQSASGANDGTSWQSAFVHLQDALTIAQAGDDVWIASGVYTPDRGMGLVSGDQSAKFSPPGGVSLYGGFKGDEVDVNSRELERYTTVLSGDLLGNDPLNISPNPASDVYLDNSIGILLVRAETEEEQSEIDSITIRGAAGESAIIALGPFCALRNLALVENVGSNAATIIQCSIESSIVARNHVSAKGAVQVRTSTIVDTVFENNISRQGGAIFIHPADSVYVVRSVFYNNRSEDGGAIFSSGTDLVIVSSSFIANVADCAGGAIVMDENGSLTSVNNVYLYNSSLASCLGIKDGGAIVVYKSRIADFNSTFAGNSAGAKGDVLALRNSEGSFDNSIWFSNNATKDDVDLFSSSLVVRHLLHDELLSLNIETDGPTFFEAAKFASPQGADSLPGTKDDNFQLIATSPGIGAGNVLAIPRDYADLDGDRLEPTPFDALGAPRTKPHAGNVSVDLGAFEFPVPTSLDSLPELPSAACFDTYPNPFRSQLNVELKGRPDSFFEVFDMMGRRFVEPMATQSGTSVSIDTNGWPAGVYLLRSTSGNKCFNLITRY
jgi:hypothetical protein